jgi:hypothetical protein
MLSIFKITQTQISGFRKALLFLVMQSLMTQSFKTEK